MESTWNLWGRVKSSGLDETCSHWTYWFILSTMTFNITCGPFRININDLRCLSFFYWQVLQNQKSSRTLIQILWHMKYNVMYSYTILFKNLLSSYSNINDPFFEHTILWVLFIIMFQDRMQCANGLSTFENLDDAITQNMCLPSKNVLQLFTKCSNFITSLFKDLRIQTECQIIAIMRIWAISSWKLCR